MVEGRIEFARQMHLNQDEGSDPLPHRGLEDGPRLLAVFHSAKFIQDGRRMRYAPTDYLLSI